MVLIAVVLTNIYYFVAPGDCRHKHYSENRFTKESNMAKDTMSASDRLEIV